MLSTAFARRLSVLALSSLAMGVTVAHAAGATDRPITIVVPFAAGGGADVVARLLAAKLPAHLDGQTVLIDNKPGASGNIGANQVARGAADGSQYLLTNSTLTINAALQMPGTPDVRQNLVPVSLLVSSPVALGVHPSVPADSVSSFVDYLKKNPGKLSYSSCGNGTPQHFAGESIKQFAGVDMVHVPYKGCAPAVNDGLGNQVPILLSTIPNLAGHAAAGKLRMLGVASDKRLSFMPDVPALAETPPFQNLNISVWFGILAPQGVPEDTRARFDKALAATMADPAVRKEFQDRYYEVVTTGTQAMSAQIDDDLARYSQLAAQSGIRLD